LFTAGALAWATPSSTHGQIYVTNFLGNTIGEYSMSGGTINAALVTGLNSPSGIVVSGGKLYVANFAQGNAGAGSIGEYDATTGAAINPSLITGLNGPINVAVAGGHLYVGSFDDSTISVYDAAAGAPVSTPLISGIFAGRLALSGSNLYALSDAYTVGEYTLTGATVNSTLASGLPLSPDCVTASGSQLFLSYVGTSTVGKYDAVTGAVINAALVSGLSSPRGTAVSGSNLFVANAQGNTIGEYDTTTGAPVNTVLISGLNRPFGIAIVPVPEPSSLLLVVFGFAVSAYWRLHRARIRV
jgi:hypothetical protein